MKRSSASSQPESRIVVTPTDRESPYWLVKLLEEVRIAANGSPSDQTITVNITSK